MRDAWMHINIYIYAVYILAVNACELFAMQLECFHTTAPRKMKALWTVLTSPWYKLVVAGAISAAQ